MNYYKQFAEMLGLELGKEFVLTDSYGFRNDGYTYKITENGLYYKSQTYSEWFTEPSDTIEWLLNGDAKAVPKPWKPKKGDEYWSYSLKTNRTHCNIFGEYIEDYAMWKSGNCFRTEEEAKTKGKEIMEKLVKEYEEA